MENNIGIWVQTLLGGGLLSAILVGVDKFRMRPIDKNNFHIESSKTTVEIALSTLEAVNSQYKEMEEKHKELSLRVDLMSEDLNRYSSLVKHFTKYVRNLHNNWEVFRKDEEPPNMTEELKIEIFKEDDA